MTLKLLDFALFRNRNVATPVFDGPAQVRAYWEALRRDGSIPDRAQLDPRGLAGALDRVFLAEAIGRGIVQVRIAGSALTEAAGMDLRGLPLSCLFSANARPQLADALEPVINGLAATELELGAGSGKVIGRLLLLPLVDGRDRRLVLGCLGHAKGAMRPHLKLDILHRTEERLGKRPNLASPELALPDLSMPKPALADLPTPVRRLRHLTLIHARD